MIENMPLLENALKDINFLPPPFLSDIRAVGKMKIKCIKECIYGNLCRT